MKTLGSRIAHYRKKKGISQAGLAKACGWASQSRVGNYEKNTREPSLADLNLMANALSVRLEDLVMQNNIEAGPDVKGRVPLISWVQAGSWSEVCDVSAIYDVEEWLACPVAHSSQTFVLRVRGESMFNPNARKSFREGDLIFVDPERNAENGSLVIVKLENENEATFKQLVVEGSKKYLKALNPAWPNPIMEINGNASICGVVIGRFDPM